MALLKYTKHLRSSMIHELNREAGMRRKAWGRVSGTKERFLSATHQKQYDKLQEVQSLLSQMTEQEFKNIVDRMERKALDELRQQKLF